MTRLSIRKDSIETSGEVFRPICIAFQATHARLESRGILLRGVFVEAKKAWARVHTGVQEPSFHLHQRVRGNSLRAFTGHVRLVSGLLEVTPCLVVESTNEHLSHGVCRNVLWERMDHHISPLKWCRQATFMNLRACHLICVAMDWSTKANTLPWIHTFNLPPPPIQAFQAFPSPHANNWS